MFEQHFDEITAIVYHARETTIHFRKYFVSMIHGKQTTKNVNGFARLSYMNHKSYDFIENIGMNTFAFELFFFFFYFEFSFVSLHIYIILIPFAFSFIWIDLVDYFNNFSIIFPLS